MRFLYCTVSHRELGVISFSDNCRSLKFDKGSLSNNRIIDTLADSWQL